jgi:hypothetical protein
MPESLRAVMQPAHRDCLKKMLQPTEKGYRDFVVLLGKKTGTI